MELDEATQEIGGSDELLHMTLNSTLIIFVVVVGLGAME